MDTWTITEKLQEANELIASGGSPFNSDENHALIKRTLHKVMGKVRIFINLHAHHHLTQHVLATVWAHEATNTLTRKWVVYAFNGPEYFEDKAERHIAIWLRDKNGNLEFALTIEDDFSIYAPSKSVKYFEFNEKNLEKMLMKMFQTLKKMKQLKEH